MSTESNSEEEATKDNTKSKKKPASPTGAVINMVNSVIGAGVLGLPFAFAKAGLVPAILIFFLMMVFAFISLNHLIYIADATLVYSYGDVCNFIFIVI